MSKQKLLRNVARLTAISTILLIISGCVSTKDTMTGLKIKEYETPIDFNADENLSMLHTPPSEGCPVFFSSVQRMSNRDNEAAAALLNASEQASKYIAVKATSRFYSEKLNSSIKYMRDLDVVWDRDLAIDMIDRLEVQSIYRDTYGTYLTARLADTEMGMVPWIPSYSDGAPGWTTEIPKIPGYIVSVGIALQAGYVANSFAASDDQALEDLARQISVEIVTGKKTIQSGVGTAELRTNYEESEVVIPEFYILDRWRTPDARYYYTLAIAPASIIDKYKDD